MPVVADKGDYDDVGFTALKGVDRAFVPAALFGFLEARKLRELATRIRKGEV